VGQGKECVTGGDKKQRLKRKLEAESEPGGSCGPLKFINSIIQIYDIAISNNDTRFKNILSL
jgi:hypothetical protein